MKDSELKEPTEQEKIMKDLEYALTIAVLWAPEVTHAYNQSSKLMAKYGFKNPTKDN